MKRFIAIIRCLWFGLIPPALERLIYGHCHYIDGQENPWTWRGHCKGNMESAYRLLTFAVLSDSERKFHKLDPVSDEQAHREMVAWLDKVQREAQDRGYTMFAVVETRGDGASFTHKPYEGSAAANARAAHVVWESVQGIDPDHSRK